MTLPVPLDTPLVAPLSRRPWSPNAHDPTSPSARNHDHDVEFALYDQTQRRSPDLIRTLTGHHRRSREPSDVSVEALDLADYARTLRPRQMQLDLLQPEHHIDPQDLYSRFPRSPPQSSPNSHRAPSLVSGGNTLSTVAHSLSSRGRPVHRPYSLPDTARIQSTGSMSHLSQGHGVDNAILPDSEIDITYFPPWSRNWYQSTTGKPKGGSSPPDYDLDAPPPPARLSMFDPTFKPKADYDNDNDLYSLPSYSNGLLPSSSNQHASLREYYLPWSSDPLENGLPVNAETKEERLRMLERHFGQKAKPTAQSAYIDENGKPLVGTVDSKGYIVTEGPIKRTAFRVLQIVLALVAGGPSIYAALFIKPSEGTPPPAGKPAAFVLYALSVITTFGMLYLYVFHRCCGSRSKGHKAHGGNQVLNGMMVLPVQGLPGGKSEKQKKGKKGKKKTGGDVQVNLIVDPNAFGLGGRDDKEEAEEDDGWGSDRDTNANSARGPRRRSPRRRSVFVGLAMEKEWKRARAWLKKMTFVDAAGLILWGGTFVLIILGYRCPSGGYDGWCNAYNTSSAAACLLCVAFGVSIFFDVKDLASSKTSPRTRT